MTDSFSFLATYKVQYKNTENIEKGKDQGITRRKKYQTNQDKQKQKQRNLTGLLGEEFLGPQASKRY